MRISSIIWFGLGLMFGSMIFLQFGNNTFNHLFFVIGMILTFIGIGIIIYKNKKNWRMLLSWKNQSNFQKAFSSLFAAISISVWVTIILYYFGFPEKTLSIFTLLASIGIIIVMIASLFFIFVEMIYQKKKYSIYKFALFYFSFSLLFIILFGFLYSDNPKLGLGGLMNDKDNSIDLLDYFYFSGSTFFSTTYGDYTPIGMSRLYSITETFIGHFLTIFMFAVGAAKFMEQMKH